MIGTIGNLYTAYRWNDLHDCIAVLMQINPATKGVEKNNADGFAMDTNK